MFGLSQGEREKKVRLRHSGSEVISHHRSGRLCLGIKKGGRGPEKIKMWKIIKGVGMKTNGYGGGVKKSRGGVAN